MTIEAAQLVIGEVEACQPAHGRHEIRKEHATLDADIFRTQVELREGVFAHHLHRNPANLARAGAGDGCKQ